MSTARHHAEWLSLLDISGPFLSMPVLLRAFPQGLNEPDPDLTRTLRLTYEEWLDDAGSLAPDPALHRAWVRWVLGAVLKMPDAVIQASPDIAVPIPEYGETLRPNFAIIEPPDTHPRYPIPDNRRACSCGRCRQGKTWKSRCGGCAGKRRPPRG